MEKTLDPEQSINGKKVKIRSQILIRPMPVDITAVQNIKTLGKTRILARVNY